MQSIFISCNNMFHVKHHSDMIYIKLRGEEGEIEANGVFKRCPSLIMRAQLESTSGLHHPSLHLFKSQ
jgi:hypothetical protein